MPQANSMAELEQMIGDKMRQAMVAAQTKAFQDVKTEVQSFYSVGSPKIYSRTGKLGNSPKSSGVSGGGNQVSFDIWLDQGYGYLVPNPAFTSIGFSSYFTTPEVLEAAEAGTAHILGKSGFWARSESKIQSDLDSTFAVYFN